MVAESRSEEMAAAEPLEDGNVLQSFWGLASTDDKERISSARDLLAALSSKQVSIPGNDVLDELLDCIWALSRHRKRLAREQWHPTSGTLSSG